MIGIILATDMARHMTDINNFKSLIQEKKIENGVNAASLIDKSTPAKEFDTKQQLLEMIVHAADISTQTRPFDCAREWTYLLFDEFFHQGDVEKSKDLPVSFLCDRTTTQIPEAQPGFLNFILVPTFQVLSQAIPYCQEQYEGAKANIDNWKNHVETEEEKKTYTRTKSITDKPAKSPRQSFDIDFMDEVNELDQ